MPDYIAAVVLVSTGDFAIALAMVQEISGDVANNVPMSTPVPPQDTLAATAANTNPIDRFAAIDGLRALACIAVVYHHCYVHGGEFNFPAASVANAHLSLPYFLSYGYLGVDLFFVLSAFCLAHPMLKTNAKPFSWPDYLERRARRILPPYYIAWVLLFLGGLVIKQLHIEPLYSMNFLMAPPRELVLSLLLVVVTLNSVFWTLCLEARWYFVLPVLLGVMKRWGWKTIALFSIVVSALYCYLDNTYALHHHWLSTLLYLLTLLPVFLPTFVLGILAAQLLTSPPAWLQSPRGMMGLRALWAASLLALFLFVSPLPTKDFMLRVPIAGVLMFTTLMLALLDRKVARILSLPLLTALGAASYSIYLVHDPLIILSYAFTKPLHWSLPLQWAWYHGLLPVMLILLGYGFFLLVERPLLKKRTVIVPKNVGAIPAERGIS